MFILSPGAVIFKQNLKILKIICREVVFVFNLLLLHTSQLNLPI